jgi:HMG (high mobility group) box
LCAEEGCTEFVGDRKIATSNSTVRAQDCYSQGIRPVHLPDIATGTSEAWKAVVLCQVSQAIFVSGVKGEMEQSEIPPMPHDAADAAADASEQPAPGGGLKKPKSAYFIFLEEARSNPLFAGLKASEMAKKGGETWKAMSAEEKAVS